MLVDTRPPWFGGWFQVVPGQSVTAGGAHPWCWALCGGADHGAGTGRLPLGRGGGGAGEGCWHRNTHPWVSNETFILQHLHLRAGSPLQALRPRSS